MKATLEEELISAFRARAAALPREASEHLRAVDYHPRRHRRVVPAALGVTAVGAATAGTALVVALGGAAPAYAGWSAAPTASTPPSPSPQASQSCLGALPSDLPAGSELGSGTWQALLTDVRGPFTVALYQNNSAYMSCFTSASFTQMTQVSSNGSNGVLRVSGSSSGSGSPAEGMSAVSVGSTASGDLQNVVQSHLSATPRQPRPRSRPRPGQRPNLSSHRPRDRPRPPPLVPAPRPRLPTEPAGSSTAPARAVERSDQATRATAAVARTSPAPGTAGAPVGPDPARRSPEPHEPTAGPTSPDLVRPRGARNLPGATPASPPDRGRAWPAPG
jgi:hypothetical protein